MSFITYVGDILEEFELWSLNYGGCERNLFHMNQS